MAAGIIEDVGHSNLKMMFDCFHIQIIEGNLLRRIETMLPLIGHIQIAGVPGRHEPNIGEIAYDWLIPEIYALEYEGFIGAEYRPMTTVEAGLGWFESLCRSKE